jgi:hypothetical protein
MPVNVCVSDSLSMRVAVSESGSVRVLEPVSERV